MSVNKNRKSFLAVIKINNKKRVPSAIAVLYRIKKNIPGKPLGRINLGRQFKPGQMFKSEAERDQRVIDFLKYNGHVLAGHFRGGQFILTVV